MPTPVAAVSATLHLAIEGLIIAHSGLPLGSKVNRPLSRIACRRNVIEILERRAGDEARTGMLWVDTLD